MNNADRNKADRKAVASRLQRIKDKKRRRDGNLSSGEAAKVRDILYRDGKPFNNNAKEKKALSRNKGDKKKAKKDLANDREFHGKYDMERMKDNYKDD